MRDGVAGIRVVRVGCETPAARLLRGWGGGRETGLHSPPPVRPGKGSAWSPAVKARPGQGVGPRGLKDRRQGGPRAAGPAAGPASESPGFAPPLRA